jgi:CheY-like chemotaxis protein
MPQCFAGSKILLAEDNQVNQRVAAAMLHRLGCAVEIAANGAEAVKMWQNNDYAAILMDCQMPELDGYSAARQIRQQEVQGKRTRIVAVTANAMEGDRQRCLDAGMDDYLAKPIRFEELQRVIARNLTGDLAVPAA